MSSSCSNSSSLPFLFMSDCFSSKAGTAIVISAISANSLLLGPLCLFVLYVGAQQWRRRRSGSSSEMISNSDILTYNLAVVELIWILSNILFICNNYLPLQPHVTVFMGFFSWFGQMLISILASLERYMAVVHPVRYLGLKRGMDRIRPVIIGCLWLFPITGSSLLLFLMLNPTLGFLPTMPVVFLFLAAMTFCSISALRILIRPRPGTNARAGRMQVDQSKRAAVQTIMVIMGMLWLKFGWNVIVVMLMSSSSADVRCYANASISVFSLPNSLVLLLLFLQKAGKLPNLRDRNTGGEGGA